MSLLFLEDTHVHLEDVAVAAGWFLYDVSIEFEALSTPTPDF